MTMLTALKGSALWATVVVVVAVLGAATYLAANGTLTGADWLIVAAPVLTGVAGAAGAHLTGVAVTNAVAATTAPPAPVAPNPVTAPAGVILGPSQATVKAGG
jgi:hypothetical protein